VVTAQLTDLGNQDVQIGMPVEMVTRKIRTVIDDSGIIINGTVPVCLAGIKL